MGWSAVTERKTFYQAQLIYMDKHDLAFIRNLDAYINNVDK